MSLSCYSCTEQQAALVRVWPLFFSFIYFFGVTLVSANLCMNILVFLTLAKVLLKCHNTASYNPCYIANIQVRYILQHTVESLASLQYSLQL